MSSCVAYVGSRAGVLAALRDLIADARQSVVLQMYLFARNGDQTLLLPRPGAFPYADAVAQLLIDKKRSSPSVSIVVILDSNTPADPNRTRRRGTLIREDLERAGIPVLCANLFGARFDPRPRRVLGRMNLHLDRARVDASDWVFHQNRWQVLHNVEDHRKNLVIDGGRAGAITSHNLFDPAYDWHENLFLVTGEPARALWRSARASVNAALEIPQRVDLAGRAVIDAVLEGASDDPEPFASDLPAFSPVAGYGVEDIGGAVVSALVHDPSASLVESAQIRGRLEALFDGAAEGDELLVATTYLSDLEVLACLGRAARRGAKVRILIDSVRALPLPRLASRLTRSLVNHDATVRAGELAAELSDRFELRVHDSRDGPMMHLKTAARLGPAPALVGGQANFTPNSFSGAWLETDLETRSPEVVRAFASHFELLWKLPSSRAPRRERGPLAALTRLLRSALLRAFGVLGVRP